VGVRRIAARGEAHVVVFENIEMFYTCRRVLAAMGGVGTVEFEGRFVG
jgi:hypothetical protein